MNKEIKNKALALNQWILKQDVVQEFQKYETLVKEHPELKQIEKQLKNMQQLIVQYKHDGIACHQLISEYELKKKDYDEHPLIYNYLSLKNEVNTLINEIQFDINQQLKKKVDEIDKSLYNQSIKNKEK